MALMTGFVHRLHFKKRVACLVSPQMREKLSPKGQEQQREATAFDAFL